MSMNRRLSFSTGINTFETSIEPYEDCCTVFTPRHPQTKPSLKEVIEEEKKLDIEKMLSEVTYDREEFVY